MMASWGLPNPTSPVRTELGLKAKMQASSLSELVRMTLTADISPGSPVLIPKGNP